MIHKMFILLLIFFISTCRTLFSCHATSLMLHQVSKAQRIVPQTTLVSSFNHTPIQIPVSSFHYNLITNKDIPYFSSLDIFRLITETFIAFDVEATGETPDHRITEVGCIEVKSFRPTGRKFHSFFNPCREVTHHARKITGQTWKELKNHPLFQDKADDLLAFIKDKTIVCHDAYLDINLLHKEMNLCQKVADIQRTSHVIDTLKFAHKFYPLPKKNLGQLCFSYGVRHPGKRHSALVDAELLSMLFCKIIGGRLRNSTKNT
jgi:DNA polymerase-3 subunit epsilon